MMGFFLSFLQELRPGSSFGRSGAPFLDNPFGAACMGYLNWSSDLIIDRYDEEAVLREDGA